MNFLIILYLIFFTGLSYLRLNLAVLFLILFTPIYLIRLSILGIPSTLLELSILIAFSFLIFNNRKKILNLKNKSGQTYPFSWEIFLVLIIASISIFVGGFSNSALGILKAYFLEPIMLFILILNTIKGERGIKQIINMLALSVLLVSLVAIWQKITGQFIFNEFWAKEENRRVVSVFGYPNAVALFIGPIIALIAGSFMSRLKERGNVTNFLSQLLLFFSFFAGLLAIYFSKSKGALLAIALSMIITLLIIAGKKIKIIVFSTLLIVSSIFIYSQKNWIELKLESSLSYQIRLSQWSETIKMLNDGNFIYGTGLNNYQKKIKEYHQEGIFFNKDADPDFKRKIVLFDDKYRAERWQPLEIYLYPHNIILNFWTELGFFGMLIFIFIILKFLILSLKYYYQEKENKNKYLGLGLFSSMLIILLHGIVDVPYFKNDLSLIFWIIISILAILKLQNRWKK